jgi:hypothetical protein
VGGVRNRNIPGDDDLPTSGTIRVDSAIARLPELERSIGAYVCRVSSPGGRFAPLTAPFAVQSASFAQSVSGVVTNASGAPVPHALVAAVSGADQEYVAGTTADAAGAYVLPLPAGSFGLLPVAPGYVADAGAQPQVVLAPGQAAAADLVLQPAARTIAGTFRDAQTANGIAGIQMFFESDNGEIALGFTDAAGAFNAAVSPGSWQVGASESAVLTRGYLSTESSAAVDTTAGNVTGLALDVPRGTSLIYGRLLDSQGQPVAGVRAYCTSQQDALLGNGVTDTQGDYFCAAGPGGWSVGFSSEMLTALGLIVTSTNVTLTAGEARRVDFTTLRSTAKILGVMRNDAAVPLGNVRVSAWLRSASATPAFVSASTDAQGRLELPLFGGLWQVQLESDSAMQAGVVAPSREVTVTDGIDISAFSLVAPRVTTTLTGRVTNHLGQAVADLEVYAFAGTVDQTLKYRNAYRFPRELRARCEQRHLARGIGL